MRKLRVEPFRHFITSRIPATIKIFKYTYNLKYKAITGGLTCKEKKNIIKWNFHYEVQT
jgi:hypothetical protein